MRNRAIQVKMVKTENKVEANNPETDVQFETKVTVIGEYVREAIETAGKCALAYVLVDTLRQVAIERAKRR